MCDELFIEPFRVKYPVESIQSLYKIIPPLSPTPPAASPPPFLGLPVKQAWREYCRKWCSSAPSPSSEERILFYVDHRGAVDPSWERETPMTSGHAGTEPDQTKVFKLKKKSIQKPSLAQSFNVLCTVPQLMYWKPHILLNNIWIWRKIS